MANSRRLTNYTSNYSDCLQRAVDVVVAAAGLVLLLPFFALIAVLIRLDSPGPVLHRGRRVGRDGAEFELVKFRSMAADAAARGPGITAAGDPRVTRLGRALRRSKIDELPQLLNVWRGEMSLVGPRPEDPRYVAVYAPEQRRVLAARPGLTSPASLRYSAEEAMLAGADWETIYVQRVLPDKLAIDLEYLSRRNLWTDLGVLWQTAAAVIGKG